MEDLRLPVCEPVGKKKTLLQREKGEGHQRSHNRTRESSVEKQKGGALKRTHAKYSSSHAVTAGKQKQQLLPKVVLGMSPQKQAALKKIPK